MELAYEMKDIAQDTEENISEVEAFLAQYYLKHIVQGLILATRIGRRTWPFLSQQMQSLTTSASRTGTSTDFPSPQTCTTMLLPASCPLLSVLLYMDATV